MSAIRKSFVAAGQRAYCFLRHPLRHSVLTGITLAVSLCAARSRGDVVTYWNTVVGETVRADSTMPGPTWAARNYAMVHAAMFDTLNAIQPQFAPALVRTNSVPAGVLPEVATAAAAHGVLARLYPAQLFELDTALEDVLAAYPEGAAMDDSLNLGWSVAEQIVAWRANDGGTNIVPYTQPPAPGIWQPTPPDFSPAWGPGWGQVRPFVLTNGAQFRAPPPPSLSSPKYTAAFDQVKELGERASASRTAEQTEVGIFWGYDRAGLGPPPILYNQMAQVIADQMGNSLMDNARLFALVNLALADAGIVSWDSKYVYNFWRPVDGIRYADSDDNPDTEFDPAWEPLGAPGGGEIPDFTPPFPAYTSGHATFGAALCRMLAHFYGRDNVSFSLQSDELPGVTRQYGSFSQADEENGISRIYLGIHWIFDKDWGQITGHQTADYIFQHALIPLVPPVVQLVETNSQIVLSWPAASGDMHLEYATRLGDPNAWSPMTDYQPTMADGQMTVTMPLVGSAMFFRLHQ